MSVGWDELGRLRGLGMLPRARDVPGFYPDMARRLEALLLDCIPVGLLTWLIGDWAGAARVHFGYAGLSFGLLGWLYWSLFESSAWRATPGKRMLGYQVVDTAGARISFARATRRYFAKLLSGVFFLIGFLITDFTPRRQALHDFLAATCVVRRKALAAWVAAGSPLSAPTKLTARSVGSLVGNVLLFSIIVTFGYLCYRMIANSNDLRAFCTTLKPGMSRAQLLGAVQGNRLEERYPQDDPQAGSAMVRVPGSYPPNQCYIQFDGDQLRSASYVPFN